MAEKSAQDKAREQSIAVRILDSDRLSEEQINTEIRAFHERWSPTHVILPLSFVMESGKSRILLQANERDRYMQHQKEQGVFQANAQFAMQKEFTALTAESSGGVQVAQEAPPPPHGGSGGLRGMFRRG